MQQIVNFIIKYKYFLFFLLLEIIAISDSTRQSGMNPAMTQLEGVMEQVKVVISRCKACGGCQHEK